MRDRGDLLRAVGALLVLVVGGIHLQQYAAFIKDVPMIGVLFLLNALGAGAICVALALRPRALAALGGIGLCLGAIVSVAIAGFAPGGLFEYRESTLRTAVVLSIAAEIAAAAVLAAYLARRGAPAQA